MIPADLHLAALAIAEERFAAALATHENDAALLTPLFVHGGREELAAASYRLTATIRDFRCGDIDALEIEDARAHLETTERAVFRFRGPVSLVKVDTLRISPMITAAIRELRSY